MKANPTYHYLTLIGSLCGCLGIRNPGVRHGRLRAGKTSVTCGRCNKQTILIKMAEARLPKPMNSKQLDKKGKEWLFRQFDPGQLRRLLAPETWEKLKELTDVGN